MGVVLLRVRGLSSSYTPLLGRAKEIIYEILKEEVARVEPKKGQRPAKETGLTYVAVYFQKMEETLYTYKPKYEVVETFSYIGGYVGIWLGVSLLALFDFLETTMILLKYPFRKKKRFSQPKRA
ncbi:hypothetical protein CDAR_109661 [Caerostris darwini]|uniref:Uncharacterized protein n=1 Tax=Caerostris darwini TaxID=1538125 RepID=A0AAV4SN80_9ARAC|nr:hypothetical protein CDAR_109661 [Caerostris darwini]